MANVNLYHLTKFTFTCRLLFIITTRKSVDSHQFYSKISRFTPILSAHFSFWKFLNLNLTFAVNAMLNLSIVCFLFHKIRSPWCLLQTRGIFSILPKTLLNLVNLQRETSQVKSTKVSYFETNKLLRAILCLKLGEIIFRYLFALRFVENAAYDKAYLLDIIIHPQWIF